MKFLHCIAAFDFFTTAHKQRSYASHYQHTFYRKQEGLAVAISIARDDPSLDDPSPLPGMHRDPMHFRHRQTDGQTDVDIVAKN